MLGVTMTQIRRSKVGTTTRTERMEIRMKAVAVKRVMKSKVNLNIDN
jgi:hypothetical protein